MTALPSTDRPLTAGDVALLREGDVLRIVPNRCDAGQLRTFRRATDDGKRIVEVEDQYEDYFPDCYTFVSRPAPVPEAGEGVETQSVVDWVEYTDDIADAISDSIDMDWTSSDGARAVVRWLNENAPYSRSAALAQDLIQALAPDQGEAAHPAFGLAVRLKTALHPSPTDRVAELEAALRPFARLKVPTKPVGNAGAYSILHSDIRTAAALLSAQPRAKGEG